MNQRLQGAVLLIKLRRVYLVGLRKTEQLEVVVLKVETGELHTILKTLRAMAEQGANGRESGVY
ncbi:MAG: hypothetical protein Q8J90_06325, partial [Gallionella sp.]|nr:hypothetical protein [Gallionella sp.]